MPVATQLAEQVGVSAACGALAVPRSSFYRAQRPKAERKPRPAPVRALNRAEQEQVCQVLNSPRFQDSTPREVYATLLDEGTYLCSWRTMYRILETRDQVRERRDLLCHPAYAKPELLATGPNQLWSWDLTMGFPRFGGYTVKTQLGVAIRTGRGSGAPVPSGDVFGCRRAQCRQRDLAWLPLV